MHRLWLASVNNISRFLKCINYKLEKCLQPCFTFQLSETSFGGLNFMKPPITCEERSWNSETLLNSFQINHISLVYKEQFGLKSLILRFGLKSRRLDVRHPTILYIFWRDSSIQKGYMSVFRQPRIHTGQYLDKYCFNQWESRQRRN